MFRDRFTKHTKSKPWQFSQISACQMGAQLFWFRSSQPALPMMHRDNPYIILVATTGAQNL